MSWTVCRHLSTECTRDELFGYGLYNLASTKRIWNLHRVAPVGSAWRCSQFSVRPLADPETQDAVCVQPHVYREYVASTYSRLPRLFKRRGWVFMRGCLTPQNDGGRWGGGCGSIKELPNRARATCQRLFCFFALDAR